jgi:chemotaxis protein histidine kinase CheA
MLVLELSDDGAGIDLERLRRSIVERACRRPKPWRR